MAAVGIALFAGCVGGQPDTIPIDIMNESGKSLEYKVTVTNVDESRELLSLQGNIDPEGSASSDFEIEDPNAALKLECTVDSEEHMKRINGSGLRYIDVVIDSKSSVGIFPSKT